MLPLLLIQLGEHVQIIILSILICVASTILVNLYLIIVAVVGNRIVQNDLLLVEIFWPYRILPVALCQSGGHTAKSPPRVCSSK